VIFIWASALYVRNARPPAASTELFVIGKQWMWHIQHPEGPREIDELHVPVGVPVKVTMTSQDVIHDFYIPAFRVKKDVLPGRYSSLWFQPTKVGTYHLFCAQYCGADHAEMIGWVYVMEPSDYAAWLSGQVKTESMAQAGERIFSEFGCASCHTSEPGARGPSLVGVFGKPEKLRDGTTRVVDESFIRGAIIDPNSLQLPNFPPIMPTYKGQIDEEQVLQLIAYIKSLGTEERTASK
jgi:cytochrome c oxidase subunit II